MSERARRIASVCLVMAVTVAVRLPFLLRGDRFFAADEAVEGLMARHVLNGEYPLFFWGQAYKGVPEVYAAALVFKMAGSSVIALQSVPLAVFAVFVGLQFILIERLFSTSIAWLTTFFTIAGPPSLVYWSLVGVAEIAVTLLVGVVLLLAWERWRTSGSRSSLALAAFAVGFGLWVQQYILYYIVALAVGAWLEMPKETRSPRLLLSTDAAPGSVIVLSRVLFVLAGIYAALALYAFVTAGFTSVVMGFTVQVTHPQKMAEVAVACAAAAALPRWWARELRTGEPRVVRSTVVAGAAFLAGFGPFIVGRISGGGTRAPLHSVNAGEMWQAVGRIGSELVPILFGFRGPGTEPLSLSRWWMLVPVVAVVLGYMGLRGSTKTKFFHVFVVVSVVIFVASGAFVDAQSFRYLMPLYAALPVVYAIGVYTAWQWYRALGVAVAAGLLTLSTLQEVSWYRVLQPDTRMARAVECVRERGVTRAWADYWTSYKITFFTGEQAIVAPIDVDRYPPYPALVREDRQAPTIRVPDTADAPCDEVVRR